MKTQTREDENGGRSARFRSKDGCADRFQYFLRWRPPVLLIVFLVFKRMRGVKNVRGAFTLSCTVLGFALFPVGFEQARRIVEVLLLHFPIQRSVVVECENQKIQIRNILGFAVSTLRVANSGSLSCDSREYQSVQSGVRESPDVVVVVNKKCAHPKSHTRPSLRE